MKLVMLVLTFILHINFVFATEQQSEKRVAILISSYGDIGHENLSYDLEELAQTYLVLHDNGIKLDIVSPKGGAVLVKNNKDDLAYIQRFKEKTSALKQLNATIASKDINVEDYDGIFVIGGSGAMFDLPIEKNTQRMLSSFVHKNKIIAAVCHGPASLVNIKTKEGNYFVTDKKVNSFTNTEEHAFGGDSAKQFPFLLEDKLKERGAIFTANSPMLPFVAVDGNLITAQNPGAVAMAAEALIVKLGLKVKPRIKFRDEATLALINEARSSGSYLIDLAINSQPELYDLNYFALYGFYSYGLAKSNEDKLKELELMTAVSRHFEHPTFMANLIKAQLEQGFEKEAKQSFNQLKEKYPDEKVTAEVALLL